MRLERARVQNYRSIRDTGEFEVELGKTILVGPNEAGKSALLQALQQINAPKGVKGFNPLRDYPRALYDDINRGTVSPDDIPVVTATFRLSDDELDLLPSSWKTPNCRYVLTRYLSNRYTHSVIGALPVPTYGQLKPDLIRLAEHLDSRAGSSPGPQSSALTRITAEWNNQKVMHVAAAKPLLTWLDTIYPKIDEENEREIQRHSKLERLLQDVVGYTTALLELNASVPVFVLFSNYSRVRPVIHLGHLASRLSSGVLDDDSYDYGNSCLLKLLGFNAKELSDLGGVADPKQNQPKEMERYREQLDQRSYQLNAASLALTKEIRRVWNPDEQRSEASRLRVVADAQYLKVVVEDELGVEVELDQRSEGFQWLVSFFIVFFSETTDQHANAVLLLDEPGVSLHALKQRDFRQTLSRLSKDNQMLYTTHSPFLVGPDELDSVRVVELTDRSVGTKVHTSVTSNDPAALLPLQEALGYNLAQSLFAQQRNLILEDLTDSWYLEGVAGLLAEGRLANLNDKIALIRLSQPARSRTLSRYCMPTS
jgi:predicted ATPase